MAIDTTLTSVILSPWTTASLAYSGPSSDQLVISYANLGFVASSGDSYKSTAGDIFKVYINGVRIYRTSDSLYAAGANFLENEDSDNSVLNGVTATWGSTTDTVWTIDTANQRVTIDTDEILNTPLYKTVASTGVDGLYVLNVLAGVDGANNTGISFVSGTTIIELRRSVQDQSTPSIDFSNASILTEQDLDNSAANIFHMAQQAIVTANKGIVFDAGTGTWDAQQDAIDKKIRGIAAPVEDNDAVNKGFLSTNLTNITTVAGISGNVTTVAGIQGNVTTVAGDASDIGRVAAVDTEIGRIGTSDMAASIALIGTTGYAHASTGDIKLVADIAANVTKVADIDGNVTKVADIDDDVTDVADIDTNVTTVAGKATEIGRIGTAPMAASIALIGTDAYAHASTGDIKLVADIAANVTKVADIDDDVTAVAGLGTNGVDVTTVSNIGTDGAHVTTVAGKATEIGRLGTAPMAASIALIGTNDMANSTDGDIKVCSDNIVLIGTATTKANEAATSATNASASEVAAKNSANAVANSFDSFDDTYLGTMADGATASSGSATGAWAKDSSTVTVTSVSGTIEVGQVVTGTGIPTSPKPNILSITGSSPVTSFVLSDNMVAADASEALTFVGYGVYGAFSPAVGGKDGPLLDNDGDALATGALYFNTSDNTMKIYDGGNWIAATSAGTASLLEYKFVTTPTQVSNRTYSGTADIGGSMSYTASNTLVFLNGVLLKETVPSGATHDYVAQNGTSIVLTAAAVENDELTVVAYKSFTVADTVSSSSGGTFSGAVTFGAGLVANTVDINGGTIDGVTITGNIVGNASGTAATVTGGTQSAITTATNLTSVGTLTAATVTGLITANGGLETDTNSKIKQKGAFMQSSTHQSWVMGG
jgi:hypothetical protein